MVDNIINAVINFMARVVDRFPSWRDEVVSDGLDIECYIWVPED